MTKGELLKFLEPFTDDIEIFVNGGLDHSNLAMVTHINSVMYFHRKVTDCGEVWLNLRSPKLRVI